MVNPLIEIINYKKEVIEKLEAILSSSEIAEAKNDHHSLRPPRPCGMTVHTGIGCSWRCIYCYIEDMGFPWKSRPYPLKGLQLAYALAINPYFVPGPHGTLVAIGSVTEPFLPHTKERAFEYIEAINKYLGNPIQFSTKAFLDQDDARILKSIEPNISPLITVITLKYYRKLEPYAPTPFKRLETIRNLRLAGLNPILFYRPVIPGINDIEYKDILMKAKEYGAIGVVVGSLRVTPRILSRLSAIGFNIGKILERMPYRLQGKSRQVPVHIGDIKLKILEYAKNIGLAPLSLACMANLLTHNTSCPRMCKVGVCISKPSTPEQNIITEAGEVLGLKIMDIRVRGDSVEIKVRGSRKRSLFFQELVKCYYRICTKVITLK
ncbi:MAG: radical SAM protein [Desulfurococcales archaeon]|nr:radical SAM protein [Desulfurococcales archaeon]